MFGVDSVELFVIAIAALVFIGPKDLPKVMMAVGRWVGKVRGYARHFTAGVENMIREAELEEMERQWREQNERILAQHPASGHYPDPGRIAPPGEGAGPAIDPPEAGDEPPLPLAAPPAPDDDPRPPAMRELP